MVTKVTPRRTLEAAQHFADLGWAVIPYHAVDENGRCSCLRSDCNSPAKHPRVKEWTKRATTDSQTIEKWWEKWPRANLGILTGVRSGLIVVDVDPRNGGLESLEELEATIGALPATVTVATGGDGLHLYYACRDGEPVPSRPLKGFPGLDVKGEKGSVVAPPSIHATGTEYRFCADRLLGETMAVTEIERPEKLPGQLVDLMRGPRRTRQSAPAGAQEAILGSTAYAEAALTKECARVRTAAGGSRNVTLNQAAFSLGQLIAGGEIQQTGVEDALRSAALEAGLQESELEPTIRSGLEAGMEQPRQGASRAEPGRANARRPRNVAEKRLPQIFLRPELSAVCDEAEAALMNRDRSGIYVRTGELCKIVRDRWGQKRGIQVARGSPTIAAISSKHLRERLDLVAAWFKTDTSGNSKRVMPPLWVCETLLERGEWPFPQLEGIVESPTMRPDGSILSKPGYDKESGFIYEPRGEFPPIPEFPDQSEAVKAAKLLTDPFRDFPFLSGGDRSAVISAILSIIGRAAIEGPVPLYGPRAPAPGTGKGLVAHVISIIGTGRFPAVMTAVHGDNEVRKRILSIGLEGVPVVLIDNVGSSGESVGETRGF